MILIIYNKLETRIYYTNTTITITIINLNAIITISLSSIISIYISYI